ncbi:hypothetical protein E4U43_000509 [Claviceps pusilla]|uniref:AB hydrolase-1 domain-containing protein n=1 Tax=Claviceps pusilla TaxID=123648 RepID=A0A9P7T3L9_9HYPO|nr:hypothetical protein E4U43_000509 [Claviceps pusilla]
MAATTTVKVPHLGGITAGYRLSGDRLDSSKPTVVLVHSMCTTSSLFNAQFEDQALTDAVNLPAVESLGHGATSSISEQFTYWDTAIMTLKVMDALHVKQAFALGTSQGGYILGLLPLATSMDCESASSRAKGCWDPQQQLAPFYDKWCSATPTPEFVVDEVWRGMVCQLGFQGNASPETLSFWDATLKAVYCGDEGRRKLRMALACLLERDGLLFRLRDIKCPVYWLQGPEDPVFGNVVPKDHIKLFTAAPEATLTFIEGGRHYLSATHPEEVKEALLRMVKKYT